MAGIGVPSGQPPIVILTDGRPRCHWVLPLQPARLRYHDDEWGTPVRDPVPLFEALTLTIFEGGLSWSVVFDRRAQLRLAFRGFDPTAVAAMTTDDVDRLLLDRRMIRNRRKIEATIHNARRALAEPSLAELLWSGRRPGEHPSRRADAPAAGTDLVRLEGDMRAAGYRLVGPVVLRSLVQSVGVENGHVAGCFRAPA
jgi:DNA-3-methyladenine glycosylase I